MSEPKRILTLRLKSKWWTRIKLGDKTEELRLATDYWRKRLVDREYDEIHIWLGYAKKTDLGRLIVRKWNGCFLDEVKHEEFGAEPVEVFVIDVSQEVKFE